MTREELYRSIYSADTVYCPPQEEGCAMLEVAIGCSWSKCRFCDFARDQFRIHPMEKIQYNLEVLGQLRAEKERVFFLGENALCISTEKLLAIMEMTKQYMPKVTSFAMYARFDDVLRKSDEELKQLRAAGLEDVHIGFESGSDFILELMNKGVGTYEQLQASRKLDRAGIGYFFTVILGLGGRRYSDLHAMESAKVLSQMHPKGIWCLNLKIWPNTPLEQMVKNREIEMMNPWEMLREEWLMLKHLNVSNCFYMDTTALNQYTIQGFLPQVKPAMLSGMQQLLELHRPQ